MMTVLVVSFLLIMINNWMMLLSGLVFIFMLLLLNSNYYLDWFEVNGALGWDSLSYLLIILSVWITMLMIVSSSSIIFANNFKDIFNSTVLLLMFILLLAFSSTNILTFYIFFEASLVPTFFLILGWGYQPERLQAGVYMMMYTIFASLPLLLTLLYMLDSNLSLSMITYDSFISCPMKGALMVGSILAFMVKLPVYFVHLWLPKAHVEAPVAGSMILASVLLKLGGYGMVRITLKVSSAFNSGSWFFMTWVMVGGAYISMVCMRQVDIKFLIALSSVAHMSMVMGGILTFSISGMNGALLIMIGHGFCSSGLFCIANMAYERSGSRSLFIMKGSQNMYPYLSLWWFLLSVSNMASPPTLNLAGEINSIISLLKWSSYMAPFISILVFFAAAYSLFMYCSTQHGKNFSSSDYLSVSVREYLILLMHWLPLNFLFIKGISLQLFL